MVVRHRILSGVLYLPVIPMLLGLCKILEALGREWMMKRGVPAAMTNRLRLLYLAVPAYVLLGVA